MSGHTIDLQPEPDGQWTVTCYPSTGEGHGVIGTYADHLTAFIAAIAHDTDYAGQECA